jgi:hypothetical protein
LAIIIETVEVRDGMLVPTAAQRSYAEQRNKPEARPTEAGYVHPIGDPRYSTRFIWRSTLTGKTSNGCTFPSTGAAKAAGETHEKAIVSRANKGRLKRTQVVQVNKD